MHVMAWRTTLSESASSRGMTIFWCLRDSWKERNQRINRDMKGKTLLRERGSLFDKAHGKVTREAVHGVKVFSPASEANVFPPSQLKAVGHVDVQKGALS
ncbi:hypothetical protein BaRGS_00002675 [Batillaria attramentaria]|uniref:Uncharacterized protein n=1 Tax=Batillaria attramentaria TaxID=370345 RepID=A0ABD0M3W1_9CAEN